MLFSEPKIPQSRRAGAVDDQARRFSALQRAENSSMFQQTPVEGYIIPAFQCSSASRKFLNCGCSIAAISRVRVSVLFSEPKIPQCGNRRVSIIRRKVSVLFSEPKIPQFGWGFCFTPACNAFQCSSASRKFLNIDGIRSGVESAARVSVLFSEPKIPQSRRCPARREDLGGFSALQRAENSSIAARLNLTPYYEDVSVLFSEPKIPQSAAVAGVGGVYCRFQCSSASRKFLN